MPSLSPRLPRTRNGAQMADSDAVRSRRYRQHRQGDHSLCKGSCDRPRLAVVADGATVPMPDEVVRLEAAVRAELGEHDPLLLALATRLVRLSAGSGPAAVAALKSLGELVAQLRGDARRPARPGGRCGGWSRWTSTVTSG
jgi:hypothetical protein